MNLFDVYSLSDVNIVKGRGCHVWDDKGQQYLDLYGGHAVISIGHCHPHYVEMMTAQLNRLGFYSNSVINRLQEQLAKRLGKACGYDDYSLFLVNSGAEANENALKLASFKTGRTRVLAAGKAFHGRTSLAVEVTDIAKYNAPIIECIQGVGGLNMATAEFAQGLLEAGHRHGTILICDEIQCGYGRSGKFFAHQWLGIRPDLITVAKGIGNGFPMSGVLIAPSFEAVKGQLGTTFGGNHLACTAALAVLDVFEQEHLVDNAHEVGEYLLARLRELQQESQHIVEVRGRGLMAGAVLDIPHSEVRSRLVHEEHCFTGCAGTNILRILPPLCLTRDEVDDFIGRLGRTLAKL